MVDSKRASNILRPGQRQDPDAKRLGAVQVNAESIVDRTENLPQSVGMTGDAVAVVSAQSINDGISTLRKFVPKHIGCH